jgi:hypothetical protein
MSRKAEVKTGFERWQDGLARTVGDDSWNVYDCEIRMAVGEYNSHLQNTTSYRLLDWRLIKAMVWTETGAAHAEWKTKPMQIGVSGDPGLAAFLSGKEGSELILPSGWQERITAGSARSIPAHNIRAGIGYLLMRMATFEYKSVVVGDPNSVQEVTVRAGDSLEKIAKANGSTPDIVKRLNPDAEILRVGAVIKYQAGTVQRVITGWRPITTTTVAQRYNGGGDIYYARKLDYSLGLIKKGRDAACK